MVKHLHHELLLDGAAADYAGGTLGWRVRGGRFDSQSPRRTSAPD